MTIISNLYEFLYNFLGVGFSSAVAMFLSCCYYPIILTWAFFYLTQSFRDPLPWENCGNWWNNETTCVANFTGIANASNYTTAVREYWESVTNNSNIFSSYKREFFFTDAESCRLQTESTIWEECGGNLSDACLSSGSSVTLLFSKELNPLER